MASPTTAPPRARLQWWPTLVGIAFAAFVSYGLSNGVDLAPVLAASGFVYLGAAALQMRTAAWPLFLVTFVVIGLVSSGVASFNPTWAIIVLGVLLAIYGLLRGAWRDRAGLPLQSIAMIGFGGAAALAQLIDPKLGAYLVALGLLAHAAWDAYHHRTGKVVVHSMAEFCFVLDVLVAIAIIVVTLRN
jgi:hypothetical protein